MASSWDAKDSRRDRIEAAIQREYPELIKRRFEYVHCELEAILKASGKNFSELVFRVPRQRVPRYYSTIFLVMYNFLIRENRVIFDHKRMARALEGIGDRSFNITAGGGTWSAENKKDNVNAVSGLLREFTTPAEGQRDILLEANEARIHRLLQAAVAEHSVFELKQGFHRLDEPADFDERSFNRILESISAIANDGTDGVGYVIIGVADKENDAKRIKRLYGTSPIEQHGFYVTGVDHELAKYGSSLDNYIRSWSQVVTATV